MDCPEGSDLRFGPRVDSRCRSFDFSLLFEDVVFGTIPSGVFILLAPLGLYLLSKQAIRFSHESKLLRAKLVSTQSVTRM